MKECSQCGETLPTDRFHARKASVDGLQYRCKTCVRGYPSQQPGPVAEASRRSHLRRHYGMTLEEFECLRERQAGGCAVCRRLAPLVVDHDHMTNAVRGLLCQECNLGIGKLGDTVAALRAALTYLENACPAI